jgi:phytoene dehydrogenase-like protein
MTTYDAVVVGSGPNGLAAAIVLAEAGASVLVLEAGDTPGGGARTAELTLPGFLHDVCSAIHPMAAAGSFLADHGVEVEWCEPEVELAHPLDDGTAGVLLRDVADTARANRSPRWRRLLAPVVERWADIERDVLGPFVRGLRHPVPTATIGVRSLPPATVVSRWLGSPQGGALFAGIAAHASSNLAWPLSSSVGVGLAAAGHVAGWPAARGGSASVTGALVARLESLGGRVECGVRVDSLADLPPSRATLFDTTPWQVERIAGDVVTRRTRRSWRRFRRGNGVWKVDWALSGPVPWTNPDARRAATVHVGGTWQEVAAAEAEVRRGRLPERPFVLVAQQSVVDATRAPDGAHTLWAYCHVPAGCTVDQTDAIERQLERFAPGWRDLVLARHVTSPADLSDYNANDVAGSIDGGATELHQILFRPTFAADPYRIPGTDLWICSSSTPPGPGVHGLCGLHAAKSVLRTLR